MNDRLERQEHLTRELLDAINDDSELTQRDLAKRLGVALGLANAYLRYCVDRGWVALRQAGANRYSYFLTDSGLAEKSRLTGRHLTHALTFYRRAADSCARCFATASRAGWQRLVLCGATELGEIAWLRAGEYGVVIVGTYDPACADDEFVGAPVWSRASQLPRIDGWLLTHIEDALGAYNRVAERLGGERGLVPDILGLERLSAAAARAN